MNEQLKNIIESLAMLAKQVDEIVKASDMKMNENESTTVDNTDIAEVDNTDDIIDKPVDGADEKYFEKRVGELTEYFIAGKVAVKCKESNIKSITHETVANTNRIKFNFKNGAESVFDADSGIRISSISKKRIKKEYDKLGRLIYAKYINRTKELTYHGDTDIVATEIYNDGEKTIYNENGKVILSVRDDIETTYSYHDNGRIFRRISSVEEIAYDPDGVIYYKRHKDGSETYYHNFFKIDVNKLLTDNMGKIKSMTINLDNGDSVLINNDEKIITDIINPTADDESVGIACDEYDVSIPKSDGEVIVDTNVIEEQVMEYHENSRPRLIKLTKGDEYIIKEFNDKGELLKSLNYVENKLIRSYEYNTKGEIIRDMDFNNNIELSYHPCMMEGYEGKRLLTKCDKKNKIDTEFILGDTGEDVEMIIIYNNQEKTATKIIPSENERRIIRYELDNELEIIEESGVEI